LEAQRQYVAKLRDKHFDFNLVVTDAFVRGIRDIGYKSTATALDELIDNSIQAEAQNIHIVFGFDGTTDNKPSHLAIVDDGHGMDPDMIRAAMLWGGTHREDDRSGFGRYGFGLPSASVSQGLRFSVYSLVEGGQLHGATFDLDELRAGRYQDHNNGRVVMPSAQPAALPGWLNNVSLHPIEGEWRHGTIVLIEKLDPSHLSWKTTTALQRNLLEHFGVVYRNFLRQVNIWVHGKLAEPIDPLFTTPGYRFYDIDDDHAEAFDPSIIEVKDPESRKVLGYIKVRYSYMPPTFLRLPEYKLNPKAGKGGNNARFHVRNENTGLILLRNGRQIDVIGRGGWLTTNNDDRYWGVEVDFPAALDEEFAITTSKQQVVLSDRMWEILDQANVLKAIQQFRKRYDEDTAKLKAARETERQKRASEQALEEAGKFKTRKPGGDPTERTKQSEARLEQEARRRAENSGQPYEQVKRELLLEIQSRQYRVEEVSWPGAPFYQVDQIGGQRVVYLNTSHRFYTHVYAGPETTPRLRAALEVLLLVLGDCELDAADDRRRFYETERGAWSSMLQNALDVLNKVDSIADANLSAQRVREQEEDQAVAA
jgi:hypothetical protein